MCGSPDCCSLESTMDEGLLMTREFVTVRLELDSLPVAIAKYFYYPASPRPEDWICLRRCVGSHDKALESNVLIVESNSHVHNARSMVCRENTWAGCFA